MTEEEFNRLQVGNIVISNGIDGGNSGLWVAKGIIGMVKEHTIKEGRNRIIIEFWGIKPAIRVYPEEVEKYTNG